MTTVKTQVDTHAPFDIGPALQFAMNATALSLSASINTSSNIVSNIIYTNGYKIFSFGATSTQAGTITIQRYLDTAATIVQGAALTGSLSANTAAIVSATDGLPFQTLKITVSNSSGSTAATLSNVILLFQSY